jgi:molecular chaperone DnaK
VADPGNGDVPNPEEDVVDAEVVDDEDPSASSGQAK